MPARRIPSGPVLRDKNGKPLGYRGAAYTSRFNNLSSTGSLRTAGGTSRRMQRRKAGLKLGPNHSIRSVSPPSRDPKAAARYGKRISQWVKTNPGKARWAGAGGVTAAYALGALTRRTSGVDKVTGRPTGIYRY